MLSSYAFRVLGLVVLVAGLAHERPHRRRDERGLSQSAETAILLAGAVAVAAIVVTIVTRYVRTKLSNLS